MFDSVIGDHRGVGYHGNKTGSVFKVILGIDKGDLERTGEF
jgi:hypothetical protein